MKKTHHHVRTFMGTTYEAPEIRTIGDLRVFLKEVCDDLPEDNSLAVSDVSIQNGVEYTLEKGITQ